MKIQKLKKCEKMFYLVLYEVCIRIQTACITLAAAAISSGPHHRTPTNPPTPHHLRKIPMRLVLELTPTLLRIVKELVFKLLSLIVVQ